MFGLIATLLSTLGATGLGAILKIIGGFFDHLSAAREAKERRELFRELQRSEINLNFQEKVFGSTEGGMYARTTRRIIALVGMLNFAAISILCTIYPAVPLVTFTPPEVGSSISFLWGLIQIPAFVSSTVVITTGHLAFSSLTTLGAIIGFYFTPGGRTK